MLPSAESVPGQAFFHPATKCCAFQPGLPNFLAGAILSDPGSDMAEGRAELEQRISRRVAITPGAVGPGAVFGLLYRNTPNVFGRAPGLRCPYLTAEGGCGVWRHRPGVCATWYCKHNRGAVGFRFWSLAAKLLAEVEQQLALRCIAELKAGSAELMESSAQSDVSELGGEIDWEQYQRLWGSWAGREIDFYRACHRLVNPLPWDQVEQTCGQRVRILVGLVRDAYAHLGSETIPERLRLGRVRLRGVRGGSYDVTTYSPFDPLLMPESLARCLRYFDGRPTEEALEAILREQGIHIQTSLLRRMVDFQILEPCEEAGPFRIVG